MITSILSFCGNLGRQAKQYLKQWSKPVTATLVTGALSDLTRSRADLVAENVMLRPQLIVLKRQVKRPQLTNFDHMGLVLAARCSQFWQRLSSSSNLTLSCAGIVTSHRRSMDSSFELPAVLGVLAGSCLQLLHDGHPVAGQSWPRRFVAPCIAGPNQDSPEHLSYCVGWVK